MNRSNVIDFQVYQEQHIIQIRSTEQPSSSISDDLEAALHELIQRLREGNPIKN